MKNKSIVKIFLVIFGMFNLVNVIYSQYSNDPRNPLVVAEDDYSKGNLRIVTTSDGTTYIVGEHKTSDNKTIFVSTILDVNGNVKISTQIAELGDLQNENDFNLVASNNKVLLTIGGSFFIKLNSNGSFTATKITFDSLSLIQNPLVMGTFADINDAEEIVIAFTLLNTLYIGKLDAYGDFISEGIEFDVFNSMPKVKL